MPRYTDLVSKAQDRVFGAFDQAQDAFLGAVSTVSERVGNVIPQLPALPVSLPGPKDVVDRGFAFAERILETQKRTVTNLIDALEPITSKIVTNGTPKRTRKAKTA